MKKQKKLSFAFLILMAAIAAPQMFSIPAMAASDNFSQKILPLNCIFTVENTGTGELYYVTPEACGVALQSQGVQVTGPSQASEPSAYNPLQTNTNAINSNTLALGSFAYRLPYWSPIAKTISLPKTANKSKNVASKESTTNETIAVVAVGSSLIFLFIFAFFLV